MCWKNSKVSSWVRKKGQSSSCVFLLCFHMEHFPFDPSGRQVCESLLPPALLHDTSWVSYDLILPLGTWRELQIPQVKYFGFFTEASSHSYVQSFVPCSDLFLSQEDEGRSWKFRDYNQGLLFLMTSPNLGATQKPTQSCLIRTKAWLSPPKPQRFSILCQEPGSKTKCYKRDAPSAVIT